MNPKQATPHPAGITPDDVYYILFRHKWLIAILSTATVIAAILVHAFCQVPYTSEARLIIKYVHENKAPIPTGSTTQTGSGDISSGEAVINSEIEIITSMDLANVVVSNLGPTKILAKAGGGTNSNVAAAVISKSLVAMTGKSDVVQLVFSHPDPDMVQPILAQLIDAYLAKHRQVHQPGFDESLETQKGDAQRQIKQLDLQIQGLKKDAGINDSDSVKSSSDLLNKILAEKFEAEGEYASEVARITELKNLLPKQAPALQSTNAAAPLVTVVEAVPPDKKADYDKICEQLKDLKLEEGKLTAVYASGSSLVQTSKTRVARAETLKKELEDKYPGLITMPPGDSKGTFTPASVPGADIMLALRTEVINAGALEQKIEKKTNQLSMLQNKILVMGSVEGQISQLQREKEIEEGHFAYYSQKLEEARVEEAVGPGNSNISIVESPTPPVRNLAKFNKMILGILFGGLAFAFVLPFVVELYLDRSLKRPLDVQTRLGLPFFISIPQMNGNGKSHALKNSKRVALLPGTTKEAAPPAANGHEIAPAMNGHLALWEESHSLQPFYETLRDRLMTYFEMINLTHKPKLVAVTSCAEGAGVTSTAAGLASSLSETGEGNVLLVNMNVRDGEAHHFYKGKLNCGLDEVLDKGTRESACVQGNLYVAKEHPEDDRLPRVLPKRFNHLLPKMKASDFDYIIFDMPPVSQISITPRLARFMDMVLLVIESGKTDRDAAKRAADMLSESKTNVGIVLNKNRSYLPRRFQPKV